MKLKFAAPVLAIFLMSSVGPSAVHNCWAIANDSPVDDMEILIGDSDLIVMGFVTSVRQSLDQSVVEVQVGRVFKGDPAVKSIQVKHHGGKHLVDPDEPSFTSFDKAILYLKRDGSYYRCVNGATGKKTIYNENVYIHPDNNFVSANLKKYEELLTQKIIAATPVQAVPQQPAPQSVR